MPLIDCDLVCNDITPAEWFAGSQLEQTFLLYCATSTLAGTVEDGAVNVNVVGTTPSGTATTYFAEVTEPDGEVMIPAGWVDFEVRALSGNTLAVTLSGGSAGPLYPGQALGRGLNPGYTGTAIGITVAGGDDAAQYSYTLIN